MEHPVLQYSDLLRAAQQRLLLAVFALCLGAGLLSWTKAYSEGKAGEASSGTLVCVGALVQSPGMDWGRQSIEFTLPYGPGIVAPLKSDIEALNAALRIEMDEQTLKAAEAQGRMPTPEGNVLRIAQLQVSRQTGRFSLQAVMARESSGLVTGSALWEGTCAPGKEKDRRF